MDMLALDGEHAADDVMARVPKAVDLAKVEHCVSQLRQHVRDDATRFQAVVASLSDGNKFTSHEVVAIAHKFVGGKKAKNAKSALTDIGQERLRIANALAKANSARR